MRMRYYVQRFFSRAVNVLTIAFYHDYDFNFDL